MTKRPDSTFANEAEAIADIERLRLGYEQAGHWSLAQIAWHCWTLSHTVIRDSALADGTAGESTDAQKKAQTFVDNVNADGWPAQPFPAPPGASPAADASDSSIDDLIAMLRELAAFPKPQIVHPFFGTLDIARFRKFILIHLAHHLAFLTPTKILRRTTARYVDLDAMIADIGRLRRGYTKGGNWSLPQICWHLNLAFPLPLVEEAAQSELTDAQTARQARWDHYIAHGHAPAGFEAPAEYLPPASTNDADVDALIERLDALKSFKSKFIRVAAGVMPIERARNFMLAHGWLHLSCLHPTHRKREHLSFASEHGVIADVKRLREGYAAAGNWTLAQICWHLGMTTPYPPTPGDPNAPLTPEQRQRQAFLEEILRVGSPPPGFQAPAPTVPPIQCDASAIDDYILRLEALAAFDAPLINMGAFGPVATAKCKQMVLGHAARHLAFVRPIKGPRERLRFENEDAAIADIKRLRQGYEQTGGWSLPQICWHLNQTMQARMQPPPFAPDSPEQLARKRVLERTLATGELPKGIVAPPMVQPPADAGDAAVDACIATFERLRDFAGPIAPHRLFGTMPDEVARKQNLIHVAHHLSHLIPSQGARGQGSGASQ